MPSAQLSKQSQGPGILRGAGWALGVASVAALVSTAGAHDRISTKVTWTREIGPLVERRCAACHVERGFAFPLTTYEHARPWAVAMKEVTLAGEMPPWGAAPGVGHFVNDRRLTRHELELIAAWVDGGAPRDVPDPQPASAPGTASASPSNNARGNHTAGYLDTRVPLANAVVESAAARVASVTLQVPEGLTLTGWRFEPGVPALVERVDLELGTRWLGTWTPGEAAIEFPPDAGIALGTSILLTARIMYRPPVERTIDYSAIRIRTSRDARPKTVREITVVRSWRAPQPVEMFAVRPNVEADVEAVARFASGRAEPIGVFQAPAKAPHPMYVLVRPLALPAGARVEATGPIRLLYTGGATRTVKPNVRRRPRR